MNLEEKYKKFELHNKKLIAHGQAPISFEQWDIGYNGAIVDHITTEQAKKDEVKKHIKNDSEIAEIIRDNFGGFYFNCYKNLLKLKLDKQYMFRFIYLCTYMNYDNKIEFGNAKGDNKLALEKDLQEILNLSKAETQNTKNALVEHKLIIINADKTITINDKYCTKGKIAKNKVKGSVRMMEQGIQEIYNKANAREHKLLQLFVEILPFVNFQHNILCHNPNETDIEKILPMTLKDLCKVVGYSESNSTKLKRQLLAIKVNGEDSICIVLRNVKHYIYVNPMIFYKGTDIDKLTSLRNLFKVN